MTKEEELAVVQAAVVNAMTAEGQSTIMGGVLDADDDLTVWGETTIGDYIPGGNVSLVGTYHVAIDGAVSQVSFPGG